MNKELLLEICINLSDNYKKEQKPKGRSLHTFIFDEGAFQGTTEITIRHDRLTPLAVIIMLNTINWPGFKTLIKEVQPLLFEVLINKYLIKNLKE